jgi:hypothetical protein
MAEEDKDDADEFIKSFRKHLSQVDEVSNVILRGHLEVERALDEVVDLIFFRPEYVRKIRLEFSEKLQIVKAYAPDPNAADWMAIESLNEARNSIAHRNTLERRATKVKKVRDSITGRGTREFREEVKRADDKEVVVLAAATGAAFLAYVYDSVLKVRKAIAAALDVPKPPESVVEADG